MIILVILIIIILFTKLIKDSCRTKKDFFQNQLIYGGQDLTYKTNPNGAYFHYINAENNVLYVPDNDVYTNKSLYSL